MEDNIKLIEESILNCNPIYISFDGHLNTVIPIKLENNMLTHLVQGRQYQLNILDKEYIFSEF